LHFYEIFPQLCEQVRHLIHRIYKGHAKISKGYKYAP
jgi:hypothetical protein